MLLRILTLLRSVTPRITIVNSLLEEIVGNARSSNVGVRFSGPQHIRFLHTCCLLTAWVNDGNISCVSTLVYLDNILPLLIFLSSLVSI